MAAQALKTIDYIFNKVGYIPYVSSCSGRSRQLFGGVKIISGIALAIIMGSSVITAIALTGGQLIILGVFDFYRGCVEQIPLWGNAACIIYDIYMGIF